MRNFNVLAQRVLSGELTGTIVLRNRLRIPTKDNLVEHPNEVLRMNDYPYYLKSIEKGYTATGKYIFGDMKNNPYDIVDLIPDVDNTQQTILN